MVQATPLTRERRNKKEEIKVGGWGLTYTLFSVILTGMSKTNGVEESQSRPERYLTDN